MTYPNEQLPATPLKMAPAHDAMTAAGCQWGNSWDLKFLYTLHPRFAETPSLKRSMHFKSLAKSANQSVPVLVYLILLVSRVLKFLDPMLKLGSIK